MINAVRLNRNSSVPADLVFPSHQASLLKPRPSEEMDIQRFVDEPLLVRNRLAPTIKRYANMDGANQESKCKEDRCSHAKR